MSIIIIFLILLCYLVMFFVISCDVKYSEVYKSNKILNRVDNSINAKKIKLSDIKRNINFTETEIAKYKFLDTR
ncbi:SWPV1-223 [Shearwaterpox virus]|uniref:SWPV1-223 n=1 Tax=Shearwaterpox virus TaxID=1974596 RepID=A0A1V0S836_CNPV|nr:SWPV1-223 [Shearwaterpox virus]